MASHHDKQAMRRWQASLAQLGAVVEGPGLVRLALPTPTLPPATTTNHYLVGEQTCVLVDPSTLEPKARAQLVAWVQLAQSCGLAVQALFLTHHHRDHVGAAMWLADAVQLPIWAHEKTAQLLDGVVRVDRLIGDGEVVATQADGSAWCALHTPGHAPGHLALWHAQTGQVVAGDLVAGQGTILIDPRDGDMGQYLQSLQRLATLPAATLAPAHGPVLPDAPQVLAHYRQHRLAREARILQALPEVWADPADLLPTAYGDVSRLAWPMALRSMTAHLIHLQQQGLAEGQADRWRRRAIAV